MAAIFELHCIYYSLDLAYPCAYAMVLGLLQTLVMEEQCKQQTSKGFKVLLKELRQTTKDLFPAKEDPS